MCDAIFKPHLSPRQIQILKLAGAGLNAQAIANILGIRPHTVRWHSDRALRRIGAINITNAVVKAHQYRIIDIDEITVIHPPQI